MEPGVWQAGVEAAPLHSRLRARGEERDTIHGALPLRQRPHQRAELVATVELVQEHAEAGEAG